MHHPQTATNSCARRTSSHRIEQFSRIQSIPTCQKHTKAWGAAAMIRGEHLSCWPLTTMWQPPDTGAAGGELMYGRPHVTVGVDVADMQ
jgi:hypothetical protein